MSAKRKPKGASPTPAKAEQRPHFYVAPVDDRERPRPGPCQRTGCGRPAAHPLHLTPPPDGP